MRMQTRCAAAHMLVNAVPRAWCVHSIVTICIRLTLQHIKEGQFVRACSEPEALPFCALAYALSGIIATALVAVPPVASALLAITA